MLFRCPNFIFVLSVIGSHEKIWTKYKSPVALGAVRSVLEQHYAFLSRPYGGRPSIRPFALFLRIGESSDPHAHRTTISADRSTLVAVGYGGCRGCFCFAASEAEFRFCGSGREVFRVLSIRIPGLRAPPVC